MASHAPFDLDIPLAVREQLHTALEKLSTDPLDQALIESVPEQQGVYNLFHNNAVAYVGKADNLRVRLNQHWRKIFGRRNISVQDVQFKCLSLGRNWIAIAAEDALIDMYSGQGLCAWNGAGFGIHDPGRNRDDTAVGTRHWDSMHPIREDYRLEEIQAGQYLLLPLLRTVKEALPFNFRYELIGKRGHPDFDGVEVILPKSAPAADELLVSVARALPSGWQLTLFPHQIILYKESKSYQSGRRLFP